ncbi:MAG: hypothetical protein JWO67_1867 [Streptosporangiaceae bacterium]|nr:hypothetical protein [Streptosporangiaceae bacterium]
MQELRLVAVSEDGSYLVLATAGRGTRFTLPVDDRLRAAVRGHFSRLGQFEIEVESPLRPKEIQARIRSGETAEEIAESAGIPVERIRWFEGPVLQEREYMAQQAQRVAVRRPGDSTPAPPLGEMVEERLGRRGIDLEDVEWDSWKCEDSTWRVRLSFFDDGRPSTAEWGFDPRRRQVAPLDDEAARLSAQVLQEPVPDTVTPLVPRRPAMKVVGDPRGAAPEPRSDRMRRDYIVERGRMVVPPEPAAPPAADDEREYLPEPRPAESRERYVRRPEFQPAPVEEPVAQATETPAERPSEPEPPTEQTEQTGQEPEIAQAPEAREPAVTEPKTRLRPPVPRLGPIREAPEPAQERTAADGAAAQAGVTGPAAGPEPSKAEPAGAGHVTEEPREDAPAAAEERAEPGQEPDRPLRHEVAEPAPAEPAAKVKEPAAANGTEVPAAPPANPPARPRRKSARGKRASVPSWDEIMFGTRRPE